MAKTKTYTRHNKNWTKQELNTLLEQHIDGENDKTIAHVLDRRIKGVRDKRTELMRELVNGFSKLDKDGLDKNGIDYIDFLGILKNSYEF